MARKRRDIHLPKKSQRKQSAREKRLERRPLARHLQITLTLRQVASNWNVR